VQRDPLEHKEQQDSKGHKERQDLQDLRGHKVQLVHKGHKVQQVLQEVQVLRVRVVHQELVVVAEHQAQVERVVLQEQAVHQVPLVLQVLQV
jgi:hypothetical protein